MDFFLFWAYIDSIIILVVSLLIIIIAWRAYFPRRLLILVICMFLSLIIGLIIHFISEQLAPFNSNFYLNPHLYLIFFGLLGCVLFVEYLIALELFFKHIRILLLLGILGFVLMIILYVYSEINLLTTEYSSYPIIVYISYEFSYCYGLAACLMFSIGSLKMASSDRLDDKTQRNMRIIGFLWLINAFYHMWLAWGLFYIDFSVPIALYLSILVLMWVSGETIVYIFFVRKLIKYLK
jgi:hypothetical protein